MPGNPLVALGDWGPKQGAARFEQIPRLCGLLKEENEENAEAPPPINCAASASIRPETQAD